MEPDFAVEFGQEALMTSITVAAPFLIVGIIVAILLGVIQSMTHIQDQTVSFVPKILLLAVTATLCLPWCSEHLIEFSRQAFEKPRMMPHAFVATEPEHIQQDQVAARIKP